MTRPHDTDAQRAAEAERKRAWVKDNPGRVREFGARYNANHRAALAGVEGVLTLDEVVLIMAPGVCHYCGGTKRLTLDHVIPMSQGGINRPENIVLACNACNASKHTTDRPGRWSRAHDACVQCGTTERPHKVHGVCTRCYNPRRDGPRK